MEFAGCMELHQESFLDKNRLVFYRLFVGACGADYPGYNPFIYFIF